MRNYNGVIRAGDSHTKFACFIAIAVLFCVPGMIAGLDISTTSTAILIFASFSFLGLLWAKPPVRKWHLNLPFFAPIAYLVVYALAIALASLPATLGETQFNTWLYALLVGALVAGIVITAINGARTPLQTLTDSVFLALLAICTLQLVVWSLGIEHAEVSNMPQARLRNSTLWAFGVQASRVAFPISSGIQYSAIYPSLLLAISLSRLLSGVRFVAAAVIASAMLVLIDARGFVFAPILAWITFRLISTMPARSAALIAALVPFVPVLLYKARDWSQPLISMIVPQRNSSSEMFSNRGYIWEQYFDQIHKMDISNILFGFGGFGQYVSNINSSFSKLFTEFSDIGRVLVHMHNSYIQVAVDFGIVGLAVLLILIYFLLLRVFAAHRIYGGKAIASLGIMMLTLQWSAGSEILLTPYSREGIIVVLMLWILAAVALPAPVPAEGERPRRKGLAMRARTRGTPTLRTGALRGGD
jgi:O-antigen ligase